MGRKIHNNQIKQTTLVSWKTGDNTNSSTNNVVLTEKLRTLEIVSVYLYQHFFHSLFSINLLIHMIYVL